MNINKEGIGGNTEPKDLVTRLDEKKNHRILLSHVTVADLDSSDSSRLYPNERYRSERYPQNKFSLKKT